MANPITTLRQDLLDDLALQFPDAEVLGGERTGRSQDKPRIAVFWASIGEMPDRVVVADAGFTIRYWPASPKVRDQGSSGVRDPGELEQAAWDLLDFLQTKQTTYTGVWFVRLVSVVPDYDPDEWSVEALLLVKLSNPAVL